MTIRRPVRSNLGSPQMQQLLRDAQLAQATGELIRLHREVLKKVDVVADMVQETRDTAARIRQLPKGDKGDRGEIGPRGLKGKDAPSLEEILAKVPKPKDGIDGTTPHIDMATLAAQVIAMIRTPQDGKDAVLDENKIIEEIFTKITDSKTFDWRKIPGLASEMASYRNQLAGKQYGKDTWARGGGDTIAAGSNITLVRKANGTVEINAAGGGSGTNVTTQYRLTAVQAGTDVTIDLTQLTNWATLTDLIATYRNNVPQTEGAGYDFTVSGSTLTIFNADAGEIFNVTYAYSS